MSWSTTRKKKIQNSIINKFAMSKNQNMKKLEIFATESEIQKILPRKKFFFCRGMIYSGCKQKN